ncbi:MAG: AAA family ATPase [Streptomyces sp.]|nr:AAA family ATPase [Streptomyces sp.]
MSAYERVVEALQRRGSRRSGTSGWQCPAHDDRVASLSINRGNKGAEVVINCQAGCDSGDVLAALGLTWKALRGEQAQNGTSWIASYEYTDERGAVLFVKERGEPKTFRIYRPLTGGRRQYREVFAGNGAARRVLYRLPAVLDAVREGRTVFVVEGEKDVHAAERAGAVATCNYEGAAKSDQRPKWRPEYGDCLKGAHVVIVADNDDAGYAHAAAVRADLDGKAASVHVVRGLVDAAHADLSDHLRAGHSLDDLAPLDLAPSPRPDDESELRALIAPDDTVEPEPPDIEMDSEAYFDARVEQLLGELLDSSGLDKMPALRPLVGDLLFLNTLSRIVGPSGHFKSFATIDIVGCVGTGMKWHGQHVHQGTAVYLVAEGAEGIRKRVRAWEQHHGLVMDNVLFLPRPVQAMDPEWDVLTEALRRIGPALVVVDTQARVTVGVEENSNTEMGRVVQRLDKVREVTGACVLVIHHTGHVGEHGRGATAVKGALQTELHVSKKGDRASNTIVTIKTGKQKDEEEATDLDFGLKVVTIDGEYKPDGRPVTSVVLVRLDAAEVMLRPPAEGSVEWIVQQLDKAGVPADFGRRRLSDECGRLGIKVGNDRLNEVARVRKARSPERSYSPVTQTVLSDGTGPEEIADQTGPGPVPDRIRTGTDTPVVPSSSLGRGPVVHPEPLCATCNQPLDPEWAAQGHDRHVMC